MPNEILIFSSDQHIDRVLPDDENNASSNYDLHKYSDSKKYMLAKNPAMFKDPQTIPHPYNGTGPVRRRSKVRGIRVENFFSPFTRILTNLCIF